MGITVKKAAVSPEEAERLTKICPFGRRRQPRLPLTSHFGAELLFTLSATRADYIR